MTINGLEAKINTAKDFLVEIGKAKDSDSLKPLINAYFNKSLSPEVPQSDIPYAMARVIEAYVELKPEERIKLKVIDNLNELYLDVIRKNFKGEVSAEDVAIEANNAYILAYGKALVQLANEDLESNSDNCILSANKKLNEACERTGTTIEQKKAGEKEALNSFKEERDLKKFILKYCLAGGDIINYFSQKENKTNLQKLYDEIGNNIVSACLGEEGSTNGQSAKYWTNQHDLAKKIFESLVGGTKK